MKKKLESFQYEYNYELFEMDLDSIWTNCIFYNKSESDYSKAAYRYRKRSLHYIINARSEVLKRKLLTFSQWNTLIKAKYFDLHKSNDDYVSPVSENANRGFADQHFFPGSKTPTVSLGHSFLVHNISPKVFDILWADKTLKLEVDLDSISLFESEIDTN